MLLCVCSVIDHRSQITDGFKMWLVRTKKWPMSHQMTVSVSHVLSTFDIFCDLHVLLNRCNDGNMESMFYVINNETIKNVYDAIYASGICPPIDHE